MTIISNVLLSAEEKKITTFGIITDVHVCDKPDQASVISPTAGPRYFTGGLAKLDAFVNAMNQINADFIIELGDFTDNPVDSTLSFEKKMEATQNFLTQAEARFALFKGARYHVLGNHDTDQSNKAAINAKIINTGIQANGKNYYSWDKNGVHYVVIDGSFTSKGADYSGTPGEAGFGYTWDDTIIPQEEAEWLAKDLSTTQSPVVVFTHQLLNPQDRIEKDFDVKHLYKNAEEIRSILEESGKVIAVFSGHYHDGGYQMVNAITYMVLQANVAYGNDVSYHNQYATVEIYQDGKKYRINVIGHGLQKNYDVQTEIK